MKSKDAKPGMVIKASSRWDNATYVVSDPATETITKRGRYSSSPPITRTVILARYLTVLREDHETGEALPEPIYQIGHVVKLTAQTVYDTGYADVDAWWEARKADMANTARLQAERAADKAELEHLAERLKGYGKGFENVSVTSGGLTISVEAARVLARRLV